MRTAKVDEKLKLVKLLLLDVDGVLTDGSIVIDSRGTEISRFDVRDGHGVKLLQRAGIRVGLLTSRASRAVAVRSAQLSIDLIENGATDKAQAYARIKAETGFTDREIAYIADDMVDLPVLRRVGVAVAVQDAWEGVKKVADYVTQHAGGHGAVREMAELLLRAQGRWDELVRHYSG
jgi:3-deoxy-D-manno-octulosonate 8-phosphate phosphatase (KDO 8-P phosphatase)